MPLFKYKAVTKSGQVVENKVDAMNQFMLIKKLKKNELLPIEVTQVNSLVTRKNKKQKKNIESNNSVLKSIRNEEIRKSLVSKPSFITRLKRIVNKNAKITKKDIAIFTENFYLLKKANFNNIHALSTIINTTENESFKLILEDILLGVEAGDNMYVTMEYYEGVFPPIYINMIKVGEMSGSLTNALKQAREYLDETMALNKKVKEILVPNIVQFVALLILLVAATLIMIPILQDTLNSVGSSDQLPAITLWFADFLNNLVKIWYIPVGIIAVIALAIYLYIRTPKGKYNFHYFKYKMPVFGPLIYAIEFTRLIQGILLNLKNGMRIQDALETCKNISNNLVMLSLIESAINNLLVGGSWIEPFEKAGLSSPMVTEMLRIGMQTDLTEMMEKLLEYMQIDIDNIMKKIMKVLPQIVYAIAGVMLIFVTIVVLVPMIQMYMGTWMFSAYL
ncbi:MAG: type II secretion system F family protein [Clostridia bacterium]|nr:type II secretion system F family protein [Clostridia bacterium]